MLTKSDKSRIRSTTGVVVGYLALMLLIGLVFQITLNSVTGYFRIGFDSTDGESRSGMEILIDNQTQCEYLHTPSGGLTPRIARDGKPIC